MNKCPKKCPSKAKIYVFEWTWVEENMQTRHHFHFEQCMHMDTRSEKAWGKGTPTFKSSIVLSETRCMDCIRRLFL